jgi:2-polyprenyl-6-methoxyphenol hydroxylase-like FAD-dependent oxidoreductase
MPNAGRIIGRWPGLYEQLDPTCGHSRGMTIHRYDGLKIIFQGPPDLPSDPAACAQAEAEEDAARRLSPMFDCHRGDLHRILLEYAKSVGVEVQQGVRVEKYEETGEGASVVVDGERKVADVVIAADGVKSAGRKAVLGFKDQPKSSG